MTSVRRWTVQDLEDFPRDDGNRYEIIDGDLYVATQPSLAHQLVSHNCIRALDHWSLTAGVVIPAPGVIFSEDQAVAPDLVWVSRARLSALVGSDGKLHAAPDLVIEVLSPGRENARRDREIKLALYGQQRVQDYWVVDWPQRRVELYRPEAGVLRLIATLGEEDSLESPVLPGFSCPVRELFVDLPLAQEG